MKDHIEIRPDKRFKPGNTKVTGNVIRGNPETVTMKHLGMSRILNPPIVVSPEMAAEIKKLNPEIGE